MEIEGKVKVVPAPQRGQGQRGPWTRSTVVIEYVSGRYVNTLALECGSNKAEDFAKLPVGTNAKFFFEPVSREYNGKYYTSANCYDWKVEGGQALTPPPAPEDLP